MKGKIMKKRLTFILIVTLLFAMGVQADTEYYIERFIDLDYCNTAKTTADWNTIDQLGAPGRLSARQIANTSNTSTGPSSDIATNGKYLFVARSGSGGLSVHDPISHTRIKNLNTGNAEQGVAIYGRYAYLVSSGGLITKIDVSNFPAGDFDYWANSDFAGTDMYAVAVSNGWLYIASDAGLIAREDYDGSSYTVVTTDARDVAIYGPYILLADGDGGLQVYSHWNTGAVPELLATETMADCRNVSVYGTTALVSAGDSLFVVDMTDPTLPSVVNRLGTVGECNSACVQSGKVYAACGASGTMVFVGEDFSALRPLGIVQNPWGGSSNAVLATGHQVAVGQGGSVLSVQYLSQGNEIQPSSDWNETGLTSETPVIAATVHGDYLYVSEQTYGLQVYDLKTMERTARIIIPSGTSATGLCAAGNYLLQGLGVGGVICYNLDNPALPVEVWTETTIFGGATVMDIEAEGPYVYVAVAGFGTTGIYKLSITDGSLVASQPIVSNVYNLDVSGNIVYVAATGSGLKTYSLGLSPLGTYTGSGSCEAVISENDYAYIISGAGIDILDISNPSSITLATTSSPSVSGDFLSISRFDKYLCIGKDAGSNALQFMDVSIPTSPGMPTSSIEGVSVPTGLSIPAFMQKWGKNLIVVDYINGVNSWEIYPGDCTDSLVQNSTLHSNSVNSLTGFKFINWRSWEYYPSDDKDTCDYSLFYYKSIPEAQESLRVIFSPIHGYNEYHRPIPAIWTDEAWYWIEESEGSGFDNLWWFIDINDRHDVWSEPDSSGPGYEGVWFIDSLKIGISNGDWPGSRSGRVTFSFDFGGGEEQELVLGMDSTATDRYDPGLDVPFALPLDRPYACWAIDDPAILPGVGLSASYSPARVGARPVRLILSHPATVTWDLPPDLEQGSFILDGIDLTSETSIDLPAGEYTALPGGGFSIGYRNHVNKGWNLSGIVALPVSGNPSQAFNAMSSDIWSYDETMGGYYNPSYLEQGKAYFVFANESSVGEFVGTPSDWIRTEIHPGWNLISGPSSGEVHISDIIVRPEGALWPGPIYRLTDSGYEAVEWLIPGEGYWVYGLNTAELFIGPEFSASRKVAVFHEPELSINITLTNGEIETQLRASVNANANTTDSRFAELQPPARPGSENLGYLYSPNAPTPLSAHINNKDEWELRVARNCVVSSSYPLSAMRNGNVLQIDRYGINIEAGVYKLSYDEHRLPEMISMAIQPNPFNAMAFIKINIPFDSNVELFAYDITGRKVNSILQKELPAGSHTSIWRGTDDMGRSLPTGIYYLKLNVGDERTITTKAVLLK